MAFLIVPTRNVPLPEIETLEKQTRTAGVGERSARMEEARDEVRSRQSAAKATEVNGASQVSLEGVGVWCTPM